MGDGTQADHWMPVDVSGMTSGAAAVAAGTEHTCALKSTGGVKCWGSNSYGELGDGTVYYSTVPRVVVGFDFRFNAYLPLTMP